MPFEGAEIDKGSPPESLTATALYFETDEEGKVIGLWMRQSGKSAVFVADLTGTPADGSVGTAKFAAANIDGAAGVPSARTLNTSTNFSSASDTESASRKAIGAALAALAKVWRTRHTVATQIGTGAVKETKYLLLNGQTSQSEPGGGGTALSQPWRIGWVAAEETVENLTTKCRIKAEATVANAAKVTVHVGLYKVVKGAKFTLGEEVSGSGKDLELGSSTNTGITGESGEFTIPEDGDYAVGCTVTGTPENPLAMQARLVVHNV
jgi:hypothetical protein